MTNTQRAKQLLCKMTLEEKIAQMDMIRGVALATRVHPAHFCSVDETSDFHWDRVERMIGPNGIGFVHDVYSVPKVLNRLQRWMVEKTRLGIPCIFTGEALHGLSWPGATSFPMPIELGATFDPAIIREVGHAIATETRSLGIHEILAPNLDLARDPRWGRMEETFGEDTMLSCRMAEAIVSGEQGDSLCAPDAVVTEPKHYVAHGFPQGGLNCSPAMAGEREVRSCMLPVFEAGVRSGARNIMAAYHNIDGTPLIASHHYLTDILKKEWGLRGYIRSDFGAINRLKTEHRMVETDADAIALAVNAGLDVTGFDYANEVWQTTLLQLVNEGRVSMERIDDAVIRILTIKYELGLFEHPYVEEERYRQVIRSEKHRDVCLRAAREGMTMLKNDGILPLPQTLNTVAVIGPSSRNQRLGSYASVPYGYTVNSVYDELKKRLPHTQILQEDGCAVSPMDFTAIPPEWLPGGVELSYYAGDDFTVDPLGKDNFPCIRFDWGLAKPHPLVAFSGYGVCLKGTLCPQADDFAGRLVLTCRDSIRLYVDGQLLIDGWGTHESPLSAPFVFRRGEKHDFLIEFCADCGGRQVCLAYSRAGSDGIERAVAAAGQANAVVLVCGDDTFTSGEGMDRNELKLYGPQREMIRRVAQTGKPCVLVLEVGKAVDLTQELPLMNAILLPWFGGEMGAQAIVDALLGDIDPSGRLPITFPKQVGDLPVYYSMLPGGSQAYLEGRKEPLFPFGYGLSYTSFTFDDLRALPTGPDTAEVHFTVHNTGERPGVAVPQLYLEDPVSTVVTPLKRLCAFERVALEPGETREMVWTLNREAFKLMNAKLQWVVERGRFVLHLGQSSADPDELTVEIKLEGDA